jgi:nucleoside-diphosphate-sugar epimerase
MELILERMGGADIINLANPQLIEIQELPRFVGLTKISKNESIKQASAGFFPIITKLRKLGWENRVSIEIGCKLTVDSMLQD